MGDGQPAAGETYDIVIYGGTPAGVAAVVQVKRMKKTVVLIEPTWRLGGLTTGGLGQTDIGNKAAIGGIAREFYTRVRRHYDDPRAWKWQKALQYRDGGQTRTSQGEATMWTFEPSAALKIVNDMVAEAGVEVVYSERLDRAIGTSRFWILSCTSWRCTGISTGASMPSCTVLPRTRSTVTTTLSLIKMLSFGFRLKTNMARSFCL